MRDLLLLSGGLIVGFAAAFVVSYFAAGRGPIPRTRIDR